MNFRLVSSAQTLPSPIFLGPERALAVCMGLKGPFLLPRAVSISRHTAVLVHTAGHTGSGTNGEGSWTLGSQAVNNTGYTERGALGRNKDQTGRMDKGHCLLEPHQQGPLFFPQTTVYIILLSNKIKPFVTSKSMHFTG